MAASARPAWIQADRQHRERFHRMELDERLLLRASVSRDDHALADALLFDKQLLGHAGPRSNGCGGHQGARFRFARCLPRLSGEEYENAGLALLAAPRLRNGAGEAGSGTVRVVSEDGTG